MAGSSVLYDALRCVRPIQGLQICYRCLCFNRNTEAVEAIFVYPVALCSTSAGSDVDPSSTNERVRQSTVVRMRHLLQQGVIAQVQQG
jgi:hypothetical protein